MVDWQADQDKTQQRGQQRPDRGGPHQVDLNHAGPGHIGPGHTGPLWKGQARRRFFRSPLLPLFSLVLLLILLAGALLLMAAIGQNRLAAENSRIELSNELAEMDGRLREIMLENVWWDAATTKAFAQDDWDWVDDNLGLWLLETKGLFASYLLDGANQARYAAVDGKRLAAPDLQGFGAGLSRLIAEVRQSPGEAPRLATGWELYRGQAALVAVGDFTPEYSDRPPAILRDPDAPRPLLVLVSIFQPSLIASITESPLVGNLKVVSQEKSSDIYSKSFDYPQVQLPLYGAGGEEIGYLSWYPPRPGSQFLEQVEWPLGGVLAVGLLLLWIIIRRIQAWERFQLAGVSRAQALDETGQALEGSLRTVMQSIDNGIAVFDKNRRLLLWNERFLRYTGYPREIVHPGTTAESLARYHSGVEGLDGLAFQAKVEELMRPFGHPGRFSYDIVSPENMVVEVRQSRLPDGGLVRSYLDVTQRRRAEAELQASESRYRAVVESQTEFICRRDQQGRFTFVNDAYCTFLGRHRSELLGQRAPREIHPDDQDEVRRRVRELGAGVSAVTYKYRLQVKDLGWRWLEWTDKALWMEAGEVGEVQSVGRDVTALTDAQAEALQLTKLASIGQVVAGVAHEITQPLNALAMAAENAMEACESAQEDAQQYMYQKLEGIYDQAQRLHRVVEHLRLFNRKDQPARSCLELVSVVEHSVALARRQVPLQQIELAVQLLDRPCRVRGWAFDLEQILLNLITNARDAIVERYHLESDASAPLAFQQAGAALAGGRAGRITIEMALQPVDLEQGSFRPTGLKNQPFFVIRVSDNGVGLPPQVESTVFEPFFTTKAPGSGMGLGLALCQRKAVAMGGNIVARNGRDGAIFEIFLPEQADSLDNEEQQAALQQIARQGNKETRG